MSNKEIGMAELWPIMAEQLECGRSVRFMPRGVSMLPMLRPGVDAVVLTKAPKKLKKYDLPLYVRPDGRFVLHRVVSVRADRYIMCGDNQKKLEYNVFPEQILAVAEGFYRGNKYFSCKNFFYRIYCFMRVGALKTYVFPTRAIGKIKRKIKK